MHTHVSSKPHLFQRHPIAFLLTLAVLLFTCAAATNWADALYILTGTEDSAIVLDSNADTRDFSSSLVHLKTNTSGYDILLNAGCPVTVSYRGTTTCTLSRSESVSSLLRRLSIIPNQLEMVGIDLSNKQVTLTVATDLIYYDTVREYAAYETVRQPNPNLPLGTERVIQKGANGYRFAVYEVIWSNGEMVSRQFVEETENTSVKEIVEYGTTPNADTYASVASITNHADGSGVLTFSSGVSVEFASSKSMTATAYTAGYGPVGTRTATGTTVRRGVVAVDKRVLPLGSKMFIVTKSGYVYGPAVAEDTGVRGNIVDLYMDTYQQCINFGRRGCTVYILP